MLDQREYQRAKKEYIKSKVDSKGMYKFLCNVEQRLLEQYYRWYTKILYANMLGGLRMQVSKEKARELIKLKGEGAWEFDGLVDMHERGQMSCELGHALRYCYIAKNIKTGGTLVFGSTCVGDFFDVDACGVKVLNHLKVVMHREIKEIIAIKENRWESEYQLYDGGVIGRIGQILGKEALNRIHESSLKNPEAKMFMLRFFALDMPLPTTLLAELTQDMKLEETLGDDILLDDIELLTGVYTGGNLFIGEIYKRYTTSLLDHVRTGVGIKPAEQQISKYFIGCCTLEESLREWVVRARRIETAQAYYTKLGVTTDWLQLQRDIMQETEVKAEIYLAVNLMAVFTNKEDVKRTMGRKHTFLYGNGEELNLDVLVKFNSLLEELAKKETQEYIQGIHLKRKEGDTAREETRLKEEGRMKYIQERLDNVGYQGIWSKDIVEDIIVRKKKTYASLTEKQKSVIDRHYAAMLGIDKQKETEKESSDNPTYLLRDRPDILAKIQRLQTEKEENTTQKVKDIMAAVMKNRRLTERQLKYIEGSYRKEILEVDTETRKPVGLREESIGVTANAKYKLTERPEIREMLERAQASEGYEDIPEKVRDIIVAVLKYNTISVMQLEKIEGAIKEHENNME